MMIAGLPSDVRKAAFADLLLKSFANLTRK